MKQRMSRVAAMLATTAMVAGCSATLASAPAQLPPQSGSDGARLETPLPADGDSPADPDSPVVRIAFAGDSYAEGPLEYRLASDPDNFVGPFAKTLRRADLAVLNLETAITTSGTPEPKAFTFATTEAVLPALASAGIDVVSMANNHGMDFGWPGFTDSIAAKQSIESPAVVGIGEDQVEAYDPYVAEVQDQRIAVFAATQVLDDNLAAKWTAGPDKGGLASADRLNYLTKRIGEIRDDVDTVVVFLHWGVEKYTCPTQRQIDLAEAVRQAGADIIVGGHQHRLAGGGRMGDAFVHYGLGNFLFQAASSDAEKTGVLTVDVRGREIVDYKWHPGRIYGAVPQRLTGADRDNELAYWESLRDCSGLTS